MDNNSMIDNQEHSIGLIGQGVVYQKVKYHVENMYRIIPFVKESPPQQFATCRLLVYCCDIWSPKMLQEINRRCFQSDVALLPVYMQFDEGIIGPCVIPQEKGCTSCAELRKLGATS